MLNPRRTRAVAVALGLCGCAATAQPKDLTLGRLHAAPARDLEGPISPASEVDEALAASKDEAPSRTNEEGDHAAAQALVSEEDDAVLEEPRAIDARMCKSVSLEKAPSGALQEAIDQLESAGTWIALLEHLGTTPRSCEFLFEPTNDNAATITVRFGEGSEVEYLVNDSGAHIHLRLGVPVSELDARRLAVRIEAIDSVQSSFGNISDENAARALESLMSRPPAFLTRTITDEGPPFTVRGIVRSTSMLVYRVEPGQVVRELRSTGVDGEIGELAW